MSTMILRRVYELFLPLDGSYVSEFAVNVHFSDRRHVLWRLPLPNTSSSTCSFNQSDCRKMLSYAKITVRMVSQFVNKHYNLVVQAKLSAYSCLSVLVYKPIAKKYDFIISTAPSQRGVVCCRGI